VGLLLYGVAMDVSGFSEGVTVTGQKLVRIDATTTFETIIEIPTRFIHR